MAKWPSKDLETEVNKMPASSVIGLVGTPAGLPADCRLMHDMLAGESLSRSVGFPLDLFIVYEGSQRLSSRRTWFIKVP